MAALTLDQLRKIMSNLPRPKAELYLQPLNDAMEEAGVNTKPRQAAFLAQYAHETVELHYLEEIASGDAYEPTSKDPGAQRRAHRLGNTQPGDGRRFKGRGLPQLTGRANYQACGDDLGADFISHPELAATPEWAFKVGAWYWNLKHLNDWADKGDFLKITLLINGGYNGLESRKKYFNRCQQVL